MGESKKSPAYPCGECGRAAKVLMRIGPDRDDWSYASCDLCLDYLCPEHHEEGEDGQTVCDSCYQQQAILRLRAAAY